MKSNPVKDVLLQHSIAFPARLIARIFVHVSFLTAFPGAAVIICLKFDDSIFANGEKHFRAFDWSDEKPQHYSEHIKRI